MSQDWLAALMIPEGSQSHRAASLCRRQPVVPYRQRTLPTSYIAYF